MENAVLVDFVDRLIGVASPPGSSNGTKSGRNKVDVHGYLPTGSFVINAVSPDGPKHT